MFELVRDLTELTGPTGYEDEVQDWVSHRWEQLDLSVERSPIGNVMARLGGKGPKVVLGAHADEISFRVKSIDPRGYLWLTGGRGMADQRLPEPLPLGHIARVVTDVQTVEGTFVTVTGHVLTPAQRAYYATHQMDWMDFFVDAGLSGPDEAEALGVRPGAPVITFVPTRRVGQHVVGKAMDDRVGLAILTALAQAVERERLQYEVWFASTVMEESGLAGARSAITGFDFGIIVEVGLSGDIPLVDPREVPVALGHGPVLVHKDMRAHYSRDLTRRLARAAQDRDIPVQHATFQSYISDGLEWLEQGYRTALLAFPCRYTHSPHETVSELDLSQMVQLLEAFLTTPAR